MDLKEFVRTSLVQIAEAISEAQYDASHLVAIAPAEIDGEAQPTIIDLEFDVAVSVDESEAEIEEASGHAKAGIKVLGADIGGGGEFSTSGESRTASQRVSRVRFSVPVNLTAWWKDDAGILPEAGRRREARERRKAVRDEYFSEE